MDFNDLNNFKPDISKLMADTPNIIEQQIQRQIAQSNKQSQEILDSINRQRQEREELEEKRHNELLSVGKEQLDELRTVNIQLEGKLDSVNQTLDFILNSMGANFQRIERHQILENEKLAELIAIISSKDDNKLKKFMTDHGVESVALVLQAVSFLCGR